MRKMILLALFLSGCGEPDRTMVLVDPLSGCKYLARFSGDPGKSLGYRDVQPITDASGKRDCSLPAH